nr:hypothetical protein [Tanacetum cinerariifolium]
KMLLAKKDKDEQVFLAEDQAWMESSSDSDQEINAKKVFMAQIKKVLSDSEASSLSADDKIYEVSYYIFESKSESEYETSEYYDNTTTYENQSKNDCQVVEKECDNVENLKVIATGMFKFSVLQSVSPISVAKTSCALNGVKNLDTLSSVRRPKPSSLMWIRKGSSNTVKADLSYVNHSNMNKNVKRYSHKNLMACLPKMKFEKDHLCFACEQGKIHRKHHKSNTTFASSNKPLYLLYMDLCRPMRDKSINGKRYVLVVVDDYSRYTWVFFLHSKDEASENKTLAKLFDEVGITQQFSAARTPQQNGVVERRNRTLVEAQEMHANLKYVESLEKEIDELESEKAEFLDMYDVILHDCVSKDVMCSYLQSLSNLDALAELQFLGKPTHFSNSLDRIYFQKTKSVPKANVSEGLSKPVTTQTLPQTAKKAIVQLIIFIVDSGCMKHVMGNLKLLCNFVEKFLGTVRFGNDQFAPILGYGDLVQGNGNDLLVGNRNRGSDLYTISLQESTSSTPLCLMAKATPTQAWLWHQRFSHLNFDYINLLLKKDIVIGLPKLKYVKDQLCSSCKLSKAKRSSFKSKVVPSFKRRLNLLHMDLCGPMRVASIYGKKYILVIVDDYSRYTWTLFLCSKDETQEVLKDFLTMIQQNLQALVITIRTDRGTEFLNKTLSAFFKKEGIEHQTSTARTPEQNGIVERQNCTLVEAA